MSSFEDVLAAAARLQSVLKDAVLVGGSAAAHHAHHRVSVGDDHVLPDLRDRFDVVLEALETTDGWVTTRVKRPVMILGSLDGIETGIRQLTRRRPLEVESVHVGRRRLRVPTLAEIFRIKAWLVLQRNATRDYVDVVALASVLGDEAPVVALELDDYYRDQLGASGRRIASQFAKQLADARPYDLDDVDLSTYRRLDTRWRDWTSVRDACRGLATAMLERL